MAFFYDNGFKCPRNIPSVRTFLKKKKSNWRAFEKWKKALKVVEIEIGNKSGLKVDKIFFAFFFKFSVQNF